MFSEGFSGSLRKSKVLLLCLAVTLFVLAAGTEAFAAAAKAAASKAAAPAPITGVGVVDLDDVMMNHPKIKEVRQQVSNLSRQKENEAKTAADRESDTARKAQIVQSKRMELAQEQQKLMEPIFRDCQQAVREVAAKQKLTLVLNKSVVLIGGVDITQDVIQQLAKKK